MKFIAVREEAKKFDPIEFKIIIESREELRMARNEMGNTSGSFFNDFYQKLNEFATEEGVF